MNNKEIEKLLKNSVKNDKLLHSYMFVGSKLTAKELISLQFAKEILCLNKNNIPCQECKSCIEIISGNHPDFVKMKLGEDENAIKIDEIREMQQDIIKKPIISNKKVYIIKNSDKMTVRSTKLLVKNFRRTTAICNDNFASRK